MENIPLRDNPPTRSFNSTDSDGGREGQGSAAELMRSAETPAVLSSVVGRSSSVAVDDESEDGVFVCNVCLEPVKDKDPVVTQCGHLYCWPCLYRWLNTNHVTCPVCKAGVTTDSVIPLFIRGNSEDPRGKVGESSSSSAGSSLGSSNIPSRPPGRRLEAPRIPDTAAAAAINDMNAPFGNTGISFSAGFGFFPSLFGLQFQSFAPAPTAGAAAAAQQGIDEEEAQQAYLSRILLLLGFSVILCLLFF